MEQDALVISEAERDVLKVLWQFRSATVREIREHLSARGRQWAHTTVNTLLARLEQKQCVTCDRSGFAHVFSPAVTRDELMRRRLETLADDYCDGKSVPLMLALVDGQKFSDEEIDQFRDLLDQLERGRKRRKRGKEQK